MPAHPPPAAIAGTGSVPAGRLAPWETGDLPAAPAPGWRLWIGLLGPGVVLAGTSIASGEWLFGPSVTAQYGGTLLWLASTSIVLQVFANLMMMRYTLWCGEPIIVGGLRTWPGPRFWVVLYALLDVASIWPYNASNAAVPLAAAILGRLPAGPDLGLVKLLGYAIFLSSLVPLIFGGTVYRMLEKVMTAKLVLVLGYLGLVAMFMVSGRVAWEVATGFLRFGFLPLRADTVVAGRHFTFKEREGPVAYTVKGTLEDGRSLIAQFEVERDGALEVYKLGSELPPDLEEKRRSLAERAIAVVRPGHFMVETQLVETERDGAKLLAEGAIGADRSWTADRLTVGGPGGTQSWERLDDVSEPSRGRFRELLENRGLERVSALAYFREHGRLPRLDWAMLVAFCAIAGAGGLSNTLFSNYARDKGWGMGKHVGAIPSAIGGRTISLSHSGKVFALGESSLARWRGWLRHIARDQVAVWMVCSFLGMALPCMLSLEFIRNATVEGNRVAALAAQGMAERYPGSGGLFWTLTLLCGFMVLAPGQVSVGDQIARRWTDIVWSASSWAKRFEGAQVKYVYYGILALYALWGLVTLGLYNPLDIAKIGAVLGNLGLGVTSLHSLYVNQVLLPRELRPSLFLQCGTAACGLFFLAISAGVLLTL
jgi:hypothetical protein